MSIIHNLSDPTNNLSGFDPVAGISDGTTIGKSYIMWKLWAGMAAFNSSFKLITSGSPTPSFLQAASTGLVAEPAQNRATTGDVIRFYNNDDPGLGQATPCAFIYEICMYYAPGFYGYTMKFYHKIGSGSVVDSGITTTNFGSMTANANEKMYCPYDMGYDTTTTTMSQIPKVFFWKSSNAFALMGVNKSDNQYRGSIIMFFPDHTTYRDTIGLTTKGVDSNIVSAILGIATPMGSMFFEAFSTSSFYSLPNTTMSNYISFLSSAGVMNTTIFNWSSANRLLSSKLRISAYNDTAGHVMKSVTDEIEGIKLVNTGQTGLPTYDAIGIFEGYYYMRFGNITDHFANYALLLQLQAV